MRSAVLMSTVSAASLLIAAGAHAQAPAAPAGDAAASAAVEEVVVTGSRIARRDFVSPTPIVTQTQENLKQAGAVNVEEGLNDLPQFTPAGDATNGGRGGGQRATLNLRGLGANRNLVLLDGRRLPFASATGQTDVNIIPTAMISGVETITGGASAVYGSDAMSGVVNFITQRRFQGLQMEAQYGNTFKSDRQTREVNVTAGGSFLDDRGNAVLSLGYSDRERLHGDERSYLFDGTLSGFLGYGAYIPTATNLPTQAALNSVFQKYDGSTANVARTGGAANIGFNDDGTLFLYNGPIRNYKGRTSGDYLIFNGQVRHPFAPTLDISSAQERRWAFGKFNYDLKPNFTLYSQILYVDSETDQDDGTTLTQFGTLNTIPVTNPFMPADLRTILASRPNPNAPIEYNGRYVGVPHKGWTDHYITSQIIGGLRGDIGVRDWTFDAYFSTDKTNEVQTQRYGVIKAKVQELWNAPDGGRSLCAGGFNPFGDAQNRNLSTECINYITATLHNTQDIKQDIVEGSVQGSLFNLPAGDLRFSVVGDHRVQDYAYVPDSRLKETGAIEATNSQTPTFGKISVNEISGELLIPVLKDMSFAQSFNIGAAIRYSDYNYSGGNTTYKVDGDWTVIQGVLLRGGYARAVRAPNMAESFFQGQIAGNGVGNPPAGGEPCDIRTSARINGGAALRTLCIQTGVPAAIVDGLINPTTNAGNSVINGNPDLRPEKADTFTAGIVLRPQFGPDALRNLSFSADFYDIKIKDVINTVNGTNVLNKCYNQDGSNPSFSPTNVYCSLITRDSGGLIYLVETPYLNLGGLHVQGIDFQIDWRQNLGPGVVTVSSVIGHKMKDATQDFVTSPWQDFVGTGTRYKWQALTTFGYRWGPAQIGVRWRYYDATKDATAVTRPASPAPSNKPFNSFDLTGTYELTDKIQIRGGITSLWQPDPPEQNPVVARTNPSPYDPYGRAFYLAIRARM